VTSARMREAEKHGFRAIVVSVDFPVSRFNSSFVEKFKDNAGDASLHRFVDMVEPSWQWKDIEWFKSNTKLPVVLKGILTGLP